MIGLFFVAFLGGFLTIAAPCILAVLPIIVGSTIGQQNKFRPLAIVAGLTISFTGFGLLFTYVTSFFGFSNNTLRNIALIFLLLFSLALIFPETYEKFIFHLEQFFKKIFPRRKTKGSPLKNIQQTSASPIQKQTEPKGKKNLLNAFMVGASLGLVWVPCAGPILGAILTLAITQSDLWKVTLLLLAYSAGAGIPMLIIAYGGNFIVNKLKVLKQKGEIIKKIAGVVLLVGVIMIGTGLDLKISSQLGILFPNVNMFEQQILEKTETPTTSQEISSENSTKTSEETPRLIPKKIVAPALTGTQAWINSEPLTLEELKGKVVIIDFWTYSCINCIRTFPYLNAWHKTYKDQGLVIIGVHTPEFSFEKELSNVEKAVKDFDIQYPVVQDNNYKTWIAYANRFWPAKYIIDKEGYIRYTHFGEGEYEETEKVIRALLEEGETKTMGDMIKIQGESIDFEKIGTPETYLGYARAEYQGNKENPAPDTITTFSEPQKIIDNHFYLTGNFLVANDYIVPQNFPAKLIMNYRANKINLVAGKDTPNGEAAVAKIYLDGAPIPSAKRGADVREDGTVVFDKDMIYNLVDTGDDYDRHIVTIEFQTPNIRVYVFTFG